MSKTTIVTPFIGFGICENDLLKLSKKKLQSLSSLFNTIQIMFSNTTPKIRKLIPITKSFSQIYIHAPYTINIANPLIESDNGLFNVGMEILLNEIENAKTIGAKSIVLHVGKNTKNTTDNNIIYNNMIMFIIGLFDLMKTRKLMFPILLETPAGQKGDVLYDIHEFVDFIKVFQNADFYEYLGVCIDTCHVFQAGIDLNDDVGLNDVFQTFAQIKSKVKLIHLNDSKNNVGERLDRHERIGFGKIAVRNLKKVMNHFKVPIILETIEPYEEQVERLH